MEQLSNADKQSLSHSLSGYFSKNEWVLYVLIALVGIAFRWYALDMRPVHHDESQHGMFGRYFYDAPEFHYYRYNPMLHGPLLYNLYRLVYNCIGSDIWSFRVPMAFLGTLYIFVPLLFRRWFSPKALLFLTAGIALGPSLIYWSRFAREDFYVLFGLLSMLIGAAGLFPRLSGTLVLFGITIQLCSKANIFVHIPIIAGYLLFEVFFLFAWKLLQEKNYKDFFFHGFLTLFSFALLIFLMLTFEFQWYQEGDFLISYLIKLVAKLAVMLAVLGFFIAEVWIALSKAGEDTLLKSFCVSFKTHWRENLCGFFICAIIYVYLYSAGGRYWQGVVDGLGVEAIRYWINQHEIERISGPFLFQFYTLTWYELPFIIFYFLHILHFYSRDRLKQCIGAALVCFSALILIPFLYFDQPLLDNPVCKFFGIKDVRDLFGLPLLLIHPIIVTVTHLLENKRKLALWGYLFTSFFFTYSYLKERVPWLSMYPLILGIIYLVIYFDDAWKEREKNSYQNNELSWYLIFTSVGALLILLGLVFIAEGRFTTIPELVTEAEVFENSGFLAFGLAFIIVGVFERWLRLFGEIRIFTFVMLCVLIYNTRMAFITNIVHPGDASEYISQVHTTKEFHNMALQMHQKLTASVTGLRPLVLGRGESTWPVTWYMAGVEGFNFDVPADKKLEDYEYIFDSWDDNEGLKKIPDGFVGRQLEFRGWWVPDFNTISFKRFLRYTINHTPWSPTGFTYLLYMSKEKK